MASKQSQGRDFVADSREIISHDQIWKTLLIYFLEDFFQLIYPELAADLCLDKVEWVDKEAFLDFPKGAHVEADLLGKTLTREGERRVLLLHHEFEGEFRRNIDIRVDRYLMHLRLKYNLTVLSVVLFLRGGPTGREIRGISDRVGPLEVHRSSYCAFGFTGLLAEEWVDRPEPLAAAFASLMRSEVWDPVEKKIRCLRAIARASVDEARRMALADVVETYVELKPEEAQRYAVELSRQSNQEIRKMKMSWSQGLRAEGKIQGVRSAIYRLWETKFGPLTETIHQRLEEMTDLSSLYEVLERVAEARSAEEIRI